MNGQTSAKQKNGSVELLRFVFTSIVIFFHINLDLWDQKKVVAVIRDVPVTFFSHGNIGVEFFFIVTGWLMAKTIYSRYIQPGNSLQKGTSAASVSGAAGRGSAAPTGAAGDKETVFGFFDREVRKLMSGKQGFQLLRGMGVFDMLFTIAAPEPAFPGEEIHPVYQRAEFRIEVGPPQAEHRIVFVDKGVAVQAFQIIRRTQVEEKEPARPNKTGQPLKQGF